MSIIQWHCQLFNDVTYSMTMSLIQWQSQLFNDNFYEHLVQAVSECYKKKRPGEKVTILEGPILIECYVSLSSMIYNQSGLGFFMDRNGICF
jgi:hypothetical protein